MEPAPKKRKYSSVWEYFDLITANKRVGYNGNTSAMLRHHRALHKDSSPGDSSSGEKTDITEAIIAMIVEDCLPFSIVEGSGFKKLVKSCNPSYVLPTRQALKAMVDKKYNENKEKAKATVSASSAERLSQVQSQMGRPTLKLIQEVETRWNSCYNMLQRLYQEREPVAAALAGLSTDISPFSSNQLNIISDSLKVLAPFNDATIELSEEKCVSGSKVIPMLTMLHTALVEEEEIVNMSTPEGITLVECLKKQLKEKLFYLQSQTVLLMSTMLDPRFKKLSFLSPHKAAEAERRLTSECASIIRHTSVAASTSSASASTSASASSPTESSQPQKRGSKLWRRLDESVQKGKTPSHL
ncbi:hypothetical protein WMY93_020531 [Mugilogobius chulae]|uniref:Hermes trasposase DNA-binding domain-containing protein n=1 Tax=Mugilogobius chulae TaxID=88201 RepID=A0AAW0NCC7_9GOBI